MNFEIYSDFGCINLALVVALWPVNFLQALWKIYLNVKINSYVFLDLKLTSVRRTLRGERDVVRISMK